MGHRLIAFDAFGTIFSPRAPIARQYLSVTQNYLADRVKSPILDNLNENHVQDLFKAGEICLPLVPWLYS
jgi:hypothetical protein